MAGNLFEAVNAIGAALAKHGEKLDRLHVAVAALAKAQTKTDNAVGRIGEKLTAIVKTQAEHGKRLDRIEGLLGGGEAPAKAAPSRSTAAKRAAETRRKNREENGEPAAAE